jgi:hypothetical protein
MNNEQDYIEVFAKEARFLLNNDGTMTVVVKSGLIGTDLSITETKNLFEKLSKFIDPSIEKRLKYLDALEDGGILDDYPMSTMDDG